MMDMRKITENFAVSPQIAPADIPAIAAAGYRSILCNRPDGEEPWQSPCAEVGTAAEAADLAFRTVPITSGQVGEDDLAAFRAALDEMPAPVLAYCRSGTRCTMLWSSVQMAHMPADEIVARTAEAGYDMSGLVAQMTRG